MLVYIILKVICLLLVPKHCLIKTILNNNNNNNSMYLKSSIQTSSIDYIYKKISI